MYKIWTIFWGWSIIGQFTIRMPNCQGTKKPTTSPTIHYSVYSHKLYLQKLPRELTRENTQESQAKVKNERTNERTSEANRTTCLGQICIGIRAASKMRCTTATGLQSAALKRDLIAVEREICFYFDFVLYKLAIEWETKPHILTKTTCVGIRMPEPKISCLLISNAWFRYLAESFKFRVLIDNR